MLITVFFSGEAYKRETFVPMFSIWSLCSDVFCMLSLQLLSPCFELRHSNVKQILTMSHKTCASRKAMHLQVAIDGAICKIKSAVNVNYKPLHICMHRSRKVLKINLQECMGLINGPNISPTLKVFSCEVRRIGLVTTSQGNCSLAGVL